MNAGSPRKVLLGAALLAAVLLPACGGGDADAAGSGKVCVSEGGATACLVDRSGGKVELEAEGFRPGSELGVAGLDPAAVDQVGAVAKVGGNGRLEGKLGSPGGGQVPEMVVTVQGTARDGSPVLLSLRRPAS